MAIDLGDAPAPPISGGIDLGDQPPPTGAAAAPVPDDPRSWYNRFGRALTHSSLITGVPDLVTSAQHGLSWLGDKAFEAVMPGAKPENSMAAWRERTGASVPYLGDTLQHAAGIPDLPADATWKERAGEAALGAGVGGLYNLGVQGAKAGFNALTTTNPLKDMEAVHQAIKQSADAGYTLARGADARYMPDTAEHVSNAIVYGRPGSPGSTANIPGQPGISNVGPPEGLLPKQLYPENAPNTYNVLARLRDTDPQTWTQAGQTVSRGYLTPADFERARRGLSNTMATAGPGDERMAAREATTLLDRFTANPPASSIYPSSVDDPRLVGQIIGDARADSAASKRLNFLGQLESGLETKAATRPTGRSTAEQLRTQIGNALALQEKGAGPLYGYSPNELQALREVSEGTPANRVMRWMAGAAPQTLKGLGMEGATAYGMTHYLTGSPYIAGAAAVGVPGVQWAAKKAAEYGTRQAYQRAQEMIAARSPWAASQGIAAPAWSAPTSSMRDAIAAASARAAIRGGVPQLEDQNAP